MFFLMNTWLWFKVRREKFSGRNSSVTSSLESASLARSLQRFASLGSRRGLFGFYSVEEASGDFLPFANSVWLQIVMKNRSKTGTVSSPPPSHTSFSLSSHHMHKILYECENIQGCKFLVHISDNDILKAGHTVCKDSLAHDRAS